MLVLSILYCLAVYELNQIGLGKEVPTVSTKL